MIYGGVFDVDSLRQRLDALDTEASRPDLWEDREAAERILRDKRSVEREVGFFDSLALDLDDAGVLLDLAAEADDEQTRLEVSEKLENAAQVLEEAEVRRMLGGEDDASNAIVAINSGAGGTDACDWAEMLMRMYLRWTERQGFKSDVLDQQAGDEAGLRGVTFTVRGEYAFGYLKAEEGVHRLVRISPFDSQARRHTAFASVTVVPEIDDAIEVDLDESDIRVDTYRSSGAGGQHVNKTDSAVRMTHVPTGIVVQCQNERSQHKNRSSALKILRARLYERARKEREDELAAARGDRRQIDFGSQIRSYTLHPQQRVKDHRTNLESGNVSAVLDGDLNQFIRATLLQRASTGSEDQ
jgi:peptide chain release factor 2